MKKIAFIFTTAVLTMSFANSFAQKDAKATEILNELSKTTREYKSITCDFTYSIKSDDINEKQQGTLQLKGDQYKYSIFGITKISNGKKICSINNSDEEIVISDVNYNDPDEFSPSEIFTIYQKGYKYRYIKETTIQSKVHHVIELYPETERDSPYRRITMYINKTENAIYKIDFFHKTSAKVFSITIDKAKYNQPIENKVFTCNCGVNTSFDCDDQTGAK